MYRWDSKKLKYSVQSTVYTWLKNFEYKSWFSETLDPATAHSNISAVLMSTTWSQTFGIVSPCDNANLNKSLEIHVSKLTISLQ